MVHLQDFAYGVQASGRGSKLISIIRENDDMYFRVCKSAGARNAFRGARVY
jgi:hypothetical protein